MDKVRVLVVDDSALVRKLLSSMLDADPDIEVVGTAADPLIAREKIKQLDPDVLTLDVEMPRMDGLTFLENLMRLHPLPVVMVSSLTERGAEVTLRALEIGAVDFFAKPNSDLSRNLSDSAQEICAKVKLAARMRSRMPMHGAKADTHAGIQASIAPPRALGGSMGGAQRIVAVGASTGGTEAIRMLLQGMPPDAPAMLITQHIPAAFSAPFAARMNQYSAMRVCQAEDGQPIQRGHAYIAPGGQHLLVLWDGARYLCRLHDGPQVNRHKPSVDLLFRSVAASVGAAAIGVLLTGMGDDGANGLLEMRDHGAPTLVQDEASSVVWGMPGAAWKLGAADEQLPIGQIAARVLALSCQPVAGLRQAAS